METGKLVKLSAVLLVALLVSLAACESTMKAPMETAETAMTVPEEPVVMAQAPAGAPMAPVGGAMEYTGDGMVRSSYAFPSGDKSTSMVWVEKSAPAEVQVGKMFSYHIQVQNMADCNFDDVIVTDQMANDFKMASAEPKPDSVTGNEAQWMLGTLEPKASRTIKITGMARKVGALAGCAKVTYRTQLCITVVAVEPKLMLTKSAPSEVLICDPIPIRYVVTNPGSGTTHNVKIMDSLPDGMETANGEKKVAIDVGHLPKGASKEFTIRARAQRTGKFTNRATAMADDGLTANASATTTVRQPVLTITKTGPKKLYLGRNFTYEVTVANRGDAVSDNTVLQDHLPDGAQFVSATHDGSHDKGFVTWQLGTLAPGAAKSVKLTVYAGCIGRYTNMAAAQGVCTDCVETSWVTELVGIPAILLEVIDVEDPIEVGSQETYVITATNQGSAVGTDIRITCTLEDAMQYVGSTGPTEASVSGATITFAPLAELAAKDKATWKVVVKAVKAGDIRFKVSMTSGQLGRPVEETEATNLYD